MKILINTSLLRFGGAVQVALSFINECRSIPGNEYHVITGRGVSRSLKTDEFSSDFYFYHLDLGPVSLFKVLTIQSKLSALERHINPDVVVTTSGPSYWHSDKPHLMGYNLPLYIYRDSPYFRVLSPYKKFRLFLKKKVHFFFFKRDADAFIVQTDDVNKRVREALGSEMVYTISNTYNSYFVNPVKIEDKLPPRTDLNEVRFLTLTSYYRHKDLEIIPQICRNLLKGGVSNFRFVVTLPDKEFQLIFGHSLNDHVTNVGSVKPEECPSLYIETDFLFLPTLAECFSAAYPEAMIMEKPIITTRLGFATDICRDAAVYYEPMDPESATDVILRLLADSQQQKQLIQNGKRRVKDFHSAPERAHMIIDICSQLVDRK